MIKEPIVRKADASSNDVGLRLDLGVEGHCCIIDTDTPTYKHHTPEAVLETAAKERKKGFIREQLMIAVVILHPLLIQSMDSYTKRHTILSEPDYCLQP